MIYEDFRLKYRPKKFAEFVGNKLPIEILKEILRSGRLPNGILFHGPPGSGKTSLAEVFSKAYYCLDYSEDVCGMCQNCIDLGKIFSDQSITFSGGIITDCTRINERTFLVNIFSNVIFGDPSQKKYPLIRILDEFDKLNKKFQEKLLRFVEFQDGSRFLIFCLIDLNKVSEAFRQRPTVLKTNQPQMEELIPWLKGICDLEGIPIEHSSALNQLILEANRLPRECLGLLQTISYLKKPLTTSLVKEVVRDIRGTGDGSSRYTMTGY
jgi:DNA polymerase-3 subunit gamma/tau